MSMASIPFSSNPVRLLEVLKTVGDAYYASCDHQQYLHIRSSSWTPDVSEGRPVIVEVFDHQGNKIIDKTKRYESNAAFSLLFPSELRGKLYYKLEKRPNIIPSPNISYESRLSPSVF